MKRRILKGLCLIECVVIILLISLFGATFLLAAHHYAHEYLGHVTFGYLTNLPLGNIPKPSIGNWEKILFVPIPQNTKFDNVYENIIISLSGPLIMILFSIVTSYLFYKYLIRKTYSKKVGVILLMLFILSISAQTIIGDVLFGGTDDWVKGNEPILKTEDYPSLEWYVHQSGLISFFILFIVISYFLFLVIFSKVAKYLFNYQQPQDYH